MIPFAIRFRVDHHFDMPAWDAGWAILAVLVVIALILIARRP